MRRASRRFPSNSGLGLEMKVIAAAVVGGAAIRGGRATLAGTVLGVVLLGAIGPALTFLGANAYWERAIEGAIHPRGGRLQMRLLLVALGAEVALFAAIAPNFLTVGNLAEITRSSVELGLLAVALTPIIVSGGIDLSVGSMMGLAAVVFGAAAARGCGRARCAAGADRRRRRRRG
jgi:ribose/xylose/arabinose/galactoside ABC-type transport system permease subunit